MSSLHILSPFLPSFIQLLRRSLYWFQVGTVNEGFSLSVQTCFFPFIFCFYLVSPILTLLALSPYLPFSLSHSPPSLSLSIAPSLPVVKQQYPCDSKLRKLPIKGNMSLTRESQGERLVCILAKERVIWRHLSWTGQFPVSGPGQKYPVKKNIQEEEKGYTSFFPHVTSCNHFATKHYFAMAVQVMAINNPIQTRTFKITCIFLLLNSSWWIETISAYLSQWDLKIIDEHSAVLDANNLPHAS